MGSPDPVQLVSDTVGMMTFGTIDIAKMRINVPLSPTAFRDFGKQTLNFATGEQLRSQINNFGDSPIAKGLSTVASAVVLTLGTAGVASSLMAPAAAGDIAGTGGAAASEAGSAVTPLAAEGTAGASPIVPTSTAIGAEGAGSADIGAELGTGIPGVPGSSAGWVPAGSGAVAPAAASKVSGMVGQTGDSAGLDASKNAWSQEVTQKAGNLNTQDTNGWFASLSPGTQAAMITGGLTVAQMGTGAMSGIFQGVSAQKRLELDQLINQQRQNQVQHLNADNSYAPLVQFKPQAQPGMVAPPQGS